MSDNNVQDLKNTPLFAKHVALGAKMVPFSGWNMPVQYTGIIEEHLHTRAKAGLFDICHMGEFTLKGSSSGKDLERLVTCSISDMPVGKCKYGFLLKEDGGIIDDLIVFKMAPYEYMLVVNAGTIAKDSAWVSTHLSGTTVFKDESPEIAKLDLQGPLSGKIMAELIGEEKIKDLKRYRFIVDKVGGVKTIVSRTGYTGELGYELFFQASSAEAIWDLLLAFPDVKPIGLGARDTLRLEMGYSLYGHEIDESCNPFEANLGRFVHMEKDFIGRSALDRRGRKGPTRTLVGFICEGRRSARSHFRVIVGGKDVGEVTSGTFSPCLQRGIGLCYMDKNVAQEGMEIILSDGKAEIKADLTSIPFYSKDSGCSVAQPLA